MRRWNGWGDASVELPLPPAAGAHLEQILGAGNPSPDASLESVLATVLPCRLPDHPLLDPQPLPRLLHARGQSLPDWVALRSGRIGVFPEAVARPANEEHVRVLFDFARRCGAHLIPYGGGTSVVGHINPLPSDRPSIALSLADFKKLVDIDLTSRLATLECGLSGPELEAIARANDLTLGHFPQSFEYSTLGGWIASRSSGQQSLFYGRIDDMLAGAHLETPVGPLDLPALPSSAAGPDLKRLVLGSEGRLGVLTRATVRLQPLPERESFRAAFFHDWDSGVMAVRRMAQERLPLSMLRLSDPEETVTSLLLSGKPRQVGVLDRVLRLLRYGEKRSMLIYAVTGGRALTAYCHRQAGSLLRAHGALPAGTLIGESWRRSRFRTPYLRNTLWEHGYALDTVETALPWARVSPACAAIKLAIQHGLEPSNETVLVFAHLSHIYRDGASIYLTILFRKAPDPDETLARWQALKAAASRSIVEQGGTISHQHGVGSDHAPYLEQENSPVGMQALKAAQAALDPHGLLNPGKLLP